MPAADFDVENAAARDAKHVASRTAALKVLGDRTNTTIRSALKTTPGSTKKLVDGYIKQYAADPDVVEAAKAAAAREAAEIAARAAALYENVTFLHT